MRTPVQYESEAARGRLRRRRRSEKRLLWFGRTAIILPTLALLFLVYSVCERAVYALTENFLIVDVESKGIAAADDDLGTYLRCELRKAFSEDGSCEGRRWVFGLLSDGIEEDLKGYLAGASTPFPSSLPVPFLVSDDVDLYLKGRRSPVQKNTTAMDVRLIEATDGFVVTPAGQGNFDGLLEPYRAALGESADRLEQQAKNQRRGLQVSAERIQTVAPEDRTELEKNIRRMQRRVDRMDAKSGSIRTRLASPDFSVKTSPDLPSILLDIGGGLLKNYGNRRW